MIGEIKIPIIICIEIDGEIPDDTPANEIINAAIKAFQNDVFDPKNDEWILFNKGYTIMDDPLP